MADGQEKVDCNCEREVLAGKFKVRVPGELTSQKQLTTLFG